MVDVGGVRGKETILNDSTRIYIYEYPELLFILYSKRDAT